MNLYNSSVVYSVTILCPTLCYSMNCNKPDFPLLYYLLEFAQIHVHWVMPSNHFILCHPLLLPSVFPSIRVFSNESALRIRWPKYWSFSLSISLSNEYLGLNAFRIWLVWSARSPRDSQESSPAPQFKSINSLALSLLYVYGLTSLHDYWKNHSFELYRPLSEKWCLCF